MTAALIVAALIYGFSCFGRAMHPDNDHSRHAEICMLLSFLIAAVLFK